MDKRLKIVPIRLTSAELGYAGQVQDFLSEVSNTPRSHSETMRTGLRLLTLIAFEHQANKAEIAARIAEASLAQAKAEQKAEIAKRENELATYKEAVGTYSKAVETYEKAVKILEERVVMARCMNLIAGRVLDAMEKRQ
jgi:hypothetical protein